MQKRLTSFLALAGLTAVEIMRQPFCLLLTTTCVLFIALLPLVITHTLGEAGKLVRDSALAFMLVCGLILGGYAACSSLAREIRKGTAAAILSKPIGRELFLLAKTTGVIMVILVFGCCVTLTTIMSVRMAARLFYIDWWAGIPLLLAAPIAYAVAGGINFLARKSFSSHAFGGLFICIACAFLVSGFFDAHGHRTPFGAHYAWNLAPAAVLIGMAIIILTALAVSLATRLDLAPTLSLCSALFLLALFSDSLIGPYVDRHILAHALYALIPNAQHFWVVDALNENGSIPWTYVADAGGYALCYVSGVLSLGLIAFRHRDVRL